MKILLEKSPDVAGLSGKIRPDSLQKSGKSGSGRILKMLIRYTSNCVEVVQLLLSACTVGLN